MLLVVAAWALTAAAQPALVEVPFGKSEAEVAPGVTFVTEPKTGEETTFSRAGATLLGLTSTRADYAFWNHRLHEVHFEFRTDEFDAVVTALTGALGEPVARAQKPGAREATWYLGAALVSAFESGGRLVVLCSDRSQKDLRWGDLLLGQGPAVIGTFVGLFLLLFLIVSAATSWCAKCHSFSMKQTGRSVAGSTDHSPSPLSVDYRENVSFSSRCSKCGHQKTDRYDGFWSPKRR
ncbi:MAG: hypothetical protein Q8L14_18530 [Myxococcales bacterium]|nr:hypothetical protein [Myxococcales bacterium]